MYNNKILSLKELASYLNCSTSTIRKLIKNEKIPFFKIGNKYYFSLLTVESWIKENERRK